MSFILDALKKSEQERRRRGIPDIHTEHSRVPARRSGTSYWPYLICFALLLNAGFLLWWLRPWHPSVTPGVQAPHTALAEAPAHPVITPAPVLPDVIPETPPQETLSIPPSVPIIVDRVDPDPVRDEVASVSVAESLPPGLHDLPRSIRTELPEIMITLHYFTDDPASRLVRINGRNLREGQQVNPNLTLQGITPEGVVLNFKGQLFSTGRN